MHLVENKNAMNDICIRLSPTRGSISVESYNPDGIISKKEISEIDLYYALNQGYASAATTDSGFLPEHCLQVSMNKLEKYYVLWNPELYADITYRDTEYLNFPIPRLVIGIRTLVSGKVIGCALGVVVDEVPTPDTIMYRYPFSNVHADGNVCTGNIVLPRYKDPLRLKYFPRYLLGLPDNDDLFEQKNNKLGLSHKQLMEHLKDKDPAYYYEHVLVPNGQTLEDFMIWR